MHLFGFYFPFDHARRTSESPRSALGAKKCSPCAKPNENLNFSKLLETAPPMLFSDHSTLLFNHLRSSYIFRACLTSELRTTPLYLVAKPSKCNRFWTTTRNLEIWTPSWGPASRPTSQPARQPAGQAATRPCSQPARQPAGQAASQPASHPTHLSPHTHHPSRSAAH